MICVEGEDGETICINKGQLKELLEKNQITTNVVPPTPNTPPAPDVCDATHLNLCSTQVDCETVSGYWYNESCNTEPETPVCNPSDEICDGIDNNCDGAVDEGCNTSGGNPPVNDTTPPVIILLGDSLFV